MLQLLWVYDEFFVTPEAWHSVFEPAGIHCRPVLNTDDAVLDTVVQLAIEEEVSLVRDGLSYEVCEQCGRKKYVSVTRGASPPLAVCPSASMARTREHFGDGGQADNRVVIGQALARSMRANGVRGASFRPVQDPG